jgi:hypothetical protein
LNSKLALGLVAAFAAIGIGIWQDGAQKPWNIFLGYWMPLITYLLYLRVSADKKKLLLSAFILITAFYAFIALMAVGMDRLFTLGGLLVVIGLIAAVWLPLVWLCRKSTAAEKPVG